MSTASGQVPCWHNATPVTDTGDTELLEREPPLAALAGYAAEARRGEGRLVLLGGEAGAGKTALVERFQQHLHGQTNAAIAAKLFISAKTAGHHVSAVLTKLGTPNRNAAAQATKLGLIS